MPTNKRTMPTSVAGRERHRLAIAPGVVSPQPSQFVHPPILWHHLLMVEETERRQHEQQELEARLRVAGDALRLGLVREATLYGLLLPPHAAPATRNPYAMHAAKCNPGAARHQRGRTGTFRRLWQHATPEQPSYVHHPVGMHASLPVEYSTMCDAIHNFSQAMPAAPPPTTATSPPDGDDVFGGASPFLDEKEDPAMNALFERFFGSSPPPAEVDDVADVTPPSDHMRGVCEAVTKPHAAPPPRVVGKHRNKPRFDRSGERLSLPNIHLISPRGKREDSSFNSDAQLDDEKLFRQYMRRLEARIRTLGAATQPSPRPAAVDTLGGVGGGPRVSGFHPSPRQPSIVLT
jgi:hypothetical protein